MPTLTPRPSTLPPDPAPAPAKARARDPQKYAVEARPSHIEGTGAFAAQNIPAKRKIGEIRGERVSTAQAYARARAAQLASGHVFMVAISERASVDATESSDPLRFANHSCAPNMVLKVQQGRVAFYALRDISAGEELTARYGPTHHGGRLACRCGAARCLGLL